MSTIPALLCIDSYKLGHITQYPEGTEIVYSNMTPRSLRHFNVPEGFDNSHLVAFGMHAAMKEIHDTFNDTFFNRDVEEVINEFRTYTAPFLGDNTFPEESLRELHERGELPLIVKALPEGAIVHAGIPVMTIMNTDPRFYWLTNYIETWLSAALWKTMTVASIARIYRLMLDHYAKVTGTPKSIVDWQGHDFSARGMSNIQDAARCGVGHLLFFYGTDNVPALYTVANNYTVEGIIGGSVPATEHSVMCMGGEADELQTYLRLITDLYPTGIVSIVSDTWDFWQVITQYTRKLKNEILARKKDSNGFAKVVIRPDSGDPVDIICGTATPIMHEAFLSACAAHNIAYGVYVTERGEYWQVWFEEVERIADPTPQMKGAIECLWDVFGGTYTETGHRLLDEHIGLIYGDSITLDRAYAILERLAKRGYASGNVVLGVGSFTYQFITRDTLGTAMKATWGIINDKEYEIFKKPKTDDGTKNSARGLLRVDEVDGEYVLEDQVTIDESDLGALDVIYFNGIFEHQKLDFNRIRQRANKGSL